MSKKNEIAVVSPQIVETGVALDKNDVVAFAVVRAEQFAQTQLDLKTKELSDAEKAMEKSRQTADKAELEFASTHLAVEAENLRNAAAAIGIKDCDARFYYDSLEARHHNGKIVEVSVTVSGSRKTSKSKAGFKAVRSLVVKTPAKLRKLYEQEQSAVRAVNKLRDEQMEWKRRLTQVPKMERMFRGQLAAHNLSQSVEGSAIVASLTADIESQVLALPCH